MLSSNLSLRNACNLLHQLNKDMTTQNSPAQSRAEQSSAEQCSVVQCRAVQSSAEQCSAVQISPHFAISNPAHSLFILTCMYVCVIYSPCETHE